MGSMTTTTTPRVIGPARRVPQLPEAWLRATLAGVEAAVFSWLIVVVPAVAAYVATAAAPVLGEASWMDAAVVGTGLWLLGHGATITMADATVSLAPLGLTLVSVLLLYGAARRARLRSHAVAGFTLAGYVATVMGISILVPGSVGRPTVAVAAVLMAALALQSALWRGRARPPAWWLRLAGRTPTFVASGIRAGAAALGALVLVAVVLTALGLVQGVVTILELHEALEPGRLGTVALVLGQLAYLPTLVVWSLAWVMGPGYSVGTGTIFSSTEVVSGPLPAVPLLGTLPEPGDPGLGWLVLVAVAIGTAVGGWLHHKRFEESWWRAVLSGVVAATVVAVAVALLTAAGAGAIGPGRMTELGAAPLAVAVAAWWQVACGAVVVLLVAHPQVHAATAGAYRTVRARLTRGTREKPAAAPEDNGEDPDGPR